MSRRSTNLATVERRRLLQAEQRETRRAEEAALDERLAETVHLSAVRGQELEQQPSKRGEGRKPLRRLSGLMWLHTKGRLTDDQFAAGARYGACYRLAKGEASIKSILNDERGSGDGQSLDSIMRQAERAAQAQAKLAMYRGQLGLESLKAACDKICGEEFTPRECSTDGHAAAILETTLGIALEMLSVIAGGASNDTRA